MARNANAFRTTAKIVGAMYVAGFIVGIGGETLIKSVLSSPSHFSILPVNSIAVAIGALLWLMAVVMDALHGVLMFPILRLHNERIAIGYLAFRILDATFIAIMVLFILLQIPLATQFLSTGASTGILQSLSKMLSQGQLYSYYIGMMTLGIAGLMLCYTLYKARLIPRFLALWGLVGYAVIFLGMASDIMGSGLSLASTLPGGLWELFIGAWLIIKGFNPSAFTHKTTVTKE